MSGIGAVLLQSLAWYAALAFVGLLALPLTLFVLRWLPDSGVAFARPLGLLVWGYLFWILVTLGVLQNDLGGALFALLLLALLSGWALWRMGLPALRARLERQRSTLARMEVLFALAFVLWVLVRAVSPAASGTEKPMELAFLNAILRSPGFPPADPWLSGYAISYYYFGYVMISLLARLSGLPGAVAFNLGAASGFALTALAAYGLLHALLRLRPARNEAAAGRGALLGPLFVLLAGNWEGFLEMLHARGLFWAGEQSRFWSWLNIQELVNPPAQPFTWEPNRPGGIWWWRASRVLSDYGLDGGFREVIDEFPLFSYLLGDLHPHVLAMPFALLAAALALNVYLQRQDRSQPGWTLAGWLRGPEFWLTALLLGGLSFLNTWDWPMYLLLFGGAVALAGAEQRGWQWRILGEAAGPVIALGMAGAVFYLPFYFSFASQAQGLLPSLVFFTRGAHLWVMFGPLLVPVFGWLLWRWWVSGARQTLATGLLLAGGLLLGLFLLMMAAAALRLNGEPGLAGLWGAGSAGELLAETVARRLAAPGGWLTLLALVGVLAALLIRRGKAEMADPGGGFVLLMLLVGAGLVTFPEFFYLRDGFGTRMNTIFKFYFQAWILLAIAAGYASAVLLAGAMRGKRLLVSAGWVVLFLVALPYAWFGLGGRLNGLAPAQLSLDGTALFPDEREAVEWLAGAPYGVVAEAIGGQYSGYARVATHSGLPTVLGWPGHEVQWRGGGQEIGSRQQDIERLYGARRWEDAEAVIAQYNIRYIVLGTLERSSYRPNEALFRRALPVGFENDLVTIFVVPQTMQEEGQAAQP